MSRKISRQEPLSTRLPPTNGPTAAATEVRPDQVPTALARSDGRKLVCRIARLPGVSSAPPMPCKTRPAIITSRFGATAQISEATANQIDAGQKGPAPAEPVAERTAQQDQRGQHQHVAVDDPLQAGDVGVQVLTHRGQRDVDDRAVQERHPGAEGGGRQHPAGPGGTESDPIG